MNWYCSLVELKAVLGITASTDDIAMGKTIEGSSRAIDKYLNRRVYIEKATKYFEGANRVWLSPDLLTVSTLKTDEDGDGTFENTFTTSDYVLLPLNEHPKTSIEISDNSAYGTFGYGKKGIEIVGEFGFGDGISSTPYTAQSTTTASITAIATALNVVSTNLSTGQTWLIDSEQIYVKDISASTASVTRAVNGTTGAVHSASSTIYVYDYPADVKEACLQMSARLWLTRDKHMAAESIGDYCLPITAEALTQNGWAKYSEINIGDKILAFDFEKDKLEWADVLNIHKSNYNGKMLKLQSRKGINTLASPNHRWYLKPMHYTAKWIKRIHSSKELNSWDSIPLSAPYLKDSTKYNDAFVECIGWFVTEGYYQHSKIGTRYSAFISQSKKNLDNCNRIRKCLTSLLGQPPSEHNKESDNIGFYIPAKTNLYKQICKESPNKQLTMRFINNLSSLQLKILWETMLLGDGDKGRFRFYQKLNETMNTFQILSILCGYGTNLKKKDIHKKPGDAVYSLSCVKPKRHLSHLIKGWVDYIGEIWCPETSLGTWIVRDNGSTFITGNSYTLNRGDPNIRGISTGMSAKEQALLDPYRKVRF